MRNLKKAGVALLWTVQILVCLAFIMTGVAKFRAPFWIDGFARWGYPDWFRVTIGVLEIVGGLLIALPATASYATALLGGILAGAAATLLLHNENPAAPIVWFVVVVLIGVSRRSRAWRPIGMRVPLAASQV